MSWWVPIALAGGFWLGYVLRHSLGITRELGAWHEGYLWGRRHESEDHNWPQIQAHIRREKEAPWN
jgi:hypothetical protein